MGHKEYNNGIDKDRFLEEFWYKILDVHSGQQDLPLVLKPDFGRRGRHVAIIRNPLQAAQYLKRYHQSRDLIAQEYQPGPQEVGIFYYRYPWEPTGHILSIVSKTFPSVYGDGSRSLRELILEFVDDRLDRRSNANAATYLSHFSKDSLATVLQSGQRLHITELGNGEQGAISTDATLRLLTPELEAAIDTISRSHEGFYIGRYDIRYADDDALRRGSGFAIVELNGVGAEDLRKRCVETPLWRFWYLTCVAVTKALLIAWWNVRVGRSARVTGLWELWSEFRK